MLVLARVLVPVLVPMLVLVLVRVPTATLPRMARLRGMWLSSEFVTSSRPNITADATTTDNRRWPPPCQDARMVLMTVALRLCRGVVIVRSAR